MKKHILFLSALAMAACFTACEDVPAPYELNFEGGETEEGGAKTLPYTETFKTSLGDYVNYTTSGAGEWICDYSTAKASGYDNTSKVTTAGTYYLVSPKISLNDASGANVKYEYILRYNKGNDNQQVLASVDFVDNPATATWVLLRKTHTEGTDWDTFANGVVNFPDDMIGKEVVVAFRYNTNATSGSTWEVKNVTVSAGKVSGADPEGATPVTPEVGGVKTLPYSESFTSSLGSFVNETTSGSGAWIIDYSTAKATGYDNASTVTTAGTYYLVSPEIDLTNVSKAHVAYEYILRYNKGNENQQFFITANYGENAAATEWTLLKNDHTEGTDWNTFYYADMNIPAEFLGKKIRVAFYYNTNATSGSTWEVRSFKISEGEAGENTGGSTGGDNTGTEVAPTGNNLVGNGDFEVWNGSTPANWKSTTSASKGALSQSSDAHGGSYSVCVAGSTSANNRLAYKELTLKPGTYNISFYVKSASSNGASVCPGYAPIKADGSMGSYVYGTYENDITATEWRQVNHSFTLTEQTKLNLVIMNSKSGGLDVLIDDYSITTSDGGSVGDTTGDNTGSDNNGGNAGDNTGSDNTGGDNTGTEVAPTGDNLVGNGDFEVWDGSTPANWKSSSTASSATLSQSPDAHAGNYSVCVAGTTSGNKRIAYKELTLKAGTYNVVFYVKAASSNGASICPGYVPFKADGTLSSYVYGTYENDLTTSEWRKVEHSFTLTEQTKLNLLIMNSKKAGLDVLIDDYVITTTDGGVVAE